jgi:MFS family permease
VSGIIFGFQALCPLLIDDGAFEDKCFNGNCDGQLLQLNWIFSICTTWTNVSALGIGLFLDYFGAQKTILFGSVVFSMGCLVTSFASDFQILYLVGFSLISVAGPTVFMGLLTQTRSFVDYQGMVMAAFVGTFDASTIVFYVFQILLRNGWVRNLSLVFRFYGILPPILSLIIWINWEIVTMPREKIDQEEGENDLIETDENAQLLCSNDDNGDQNSFLEQIKSNYFIGITIILCIYMTRLNFYISTLADQLQDLGKNNYYLKQNIPNLMEFFYIVLPIGGIVSIPIIGILLENLKFPTLFFLLGICGTLLGVLNLIPNVVAQYAAICLFVLLRPFVYSLAGDFCSKM